MINAEHLTNIYLNLYIKRVNISYLSPLKGQYNNLIKHRFILYFKISSCGIINTVDKYVDDPNNPGKYNSTYLLKLAFNKNDCNSDDQELSSSFIALLKLLNDIDKNENLEGDQLVEYAILWLSYKLNQKKENGTTIFNEFYTENIKTNDCYNKHIGDITGDKIKKDVIETKIRSMNIDIKDISNFYDAFKSLCNIKWNNSSYFVSVIILEKNILYIIRNKYIKI
ncbi:hypothetical protein YYC_05092 [Plasmodium yoelii 17X]|uniref:Plasmodium variant antigen protein Cir/Yir/Bir n=1 Tax=Plasmodium yoelii 17X TaxID=1323249 RepID=V7PDD0_PLAYE|nr:hypothetical protein YYC_05092 [Plasmodium yoelii 17X]